MIDTETSLSRVSRKLTWNNYLVFQVKGYNLTGGKRGANLPMEILESQNFFKPFDAIQKQAPLKTLVQDKRYV